MSDAFDSGGRTGAASAFSGMAISPGKQGSWEMRCGRRVSSRLGGSGYPPLRRNARAGRDKNGKGANRRTGFGSHRKPGTPAEPLDHFPEHGEIFPRADDENPAARAAAGYIGVRPGGR